MVSARACSRPQSLPGVKVILPRGDAGRFSGLPTQACAKHRVYGSRYRDHHRTSPDVRHEFDVQVLATNDDGK